MQRKPLRRTAWTLVIGGFVLFAAITAAAVLADSHGQPVGQGSVARWRAGETAALVRPIKPGSPQVGTWVTCQVNGARVLVEMRADLRPRPDDAAVTCEADVLLLTGAAREIGQVVRSGLIVLPIAMVVIGGLLFVPRFLWTMAALSTRSKTRMGDIWGEDPLGKR